MRFASQEKQTVREVISSLSIHKRETLFSLQRVSKSNSHLCPHSVEVYVLIVAGEGRGPDASDVY